MHKLVRTGIVTLAGTVVLGTAGVAIAGSAQASDYDKVIKREDTSSSWVQSTNLSSLPHAHPPVDEASMREFLGSAPAMA